MNDWNAIKAEYIAGGISQRKLAEKYGVSPSKLMHKASSEKWEASRKKVRSKSEAKVEQKVANTIASNADKLYKAYGKAIDRVSSAIETASDSGTNLLSLVSALEKLQKMGVPEDENALKAARKLLEGVESVID